MFSVTKDLQGLQIIEPRVVRVRCPGCRHMATLEALGAVKDVQFPNTSRGAMIFGQRICPNPSCRAHIFFRLAAAGGAVEIAPTESLDFDPTGLPAPVLAALDEAIRCHAAGCYVATAIMVRKTLEVLCLDQGITKGSLKDKVKDLGQTIVIPKALAAGIDDLRLLGNDAAHIEADTFNDVGKDEVEVAIDLAKELLKATYQHKALVERMAKHKKAPPTPP